MLDDAGSPSDRYGDPMNLREAFWPLLGNWTGVEQLGPGGTARAMIVFKLDLQDQAVVQDYRRVADDGSELTGHGVFVVDPVTGNLLWWFFDSAGVPPTPLRGLRVDDGLVFGPRPRAHALAGRRPAPAYGAGPGWHLPAHLRPLRLGIATRVH